MAPSAAQQQQPLNIWAQMAYTPPRGPCSQKLSVISSCPCYRFMIHPLKAATSFDCDGCGHHASFHRMESREEEEIARRWKAEEEARQGRDARVVELVESVAPKRRRIGIAPAAEDVLGFLEEEYEQRPAVVGRKRKGRGG
ncbi:hypothetical protein MMC28_001262 [Mycoblastus sanguinarius]|nr:hypothetical protein [Mycoblastus sanguinarius]